MKDIILLYSCFLLVGLLLVKSGRTVENTLKCYQCQLPAQENLNGVCQEEDLKTCPNDYAADRCITTIRKNSTTELFDITKKCALAPCEFKDTGPNNLFKLSCDLSKPDAICFKCCENDGCNLASRAESLLQRFDQSFLHNCFLTSLITALLVWAAQHLDTIESLLWDAKRSAEYFT